MDDPDQQDS